MLGTKEIKRRIRGVTNIQQITKAMEMVAASRLKRAQSRAEASRPYFYSIKSLMEDLLSWSAESGVGNPASSIQHPASRKIALILITSDRGLCGGYIGNVARQAQAFVQSALDESGQKVILIPIGKRGYDFFRRRGFSILTNFSQPSKEVTREIVEEISRFILNGYKREFQELFLLYTQFVSATRSRPVLLKLLPLEIPKERKKVEPIVEPETEQMVKDFLPQYISAELYGAMAESLASEQGARMVAMRSATDNAEEMIKNLNLRYNKARQSSITTELLEIITGAEALRTAG